MCTVDCLGKCSLKMCCHLYLLKWRRNTLMQQCTIGSQCNLIPVILSFLMSFILDARVLFVNTQDWQLSKGESTSDVKLLPPWNTRDVKLLLPRNPSGVTTNCVLFYQANDKTSLDSKFKSVRINQNLPMTTIYSLNIINKKIFGLPVICVFI